MEGEIWKPFPGDQYRHISNMGRVKIIFKNVEKIIEIKPATNGYKYTVLNKKSITLHRVVMLVFVGEPGKMRVDHINGIKHDNRLENLEYVTHSENIKRIWVQNKLKSELQKLNTSKSDQPKKIVKVLGQMVFEGSARWKKLTQQKTLIEQISLNERSFKIPRIDARNNSN